MITPYNQPNDTLRGSRNYMIMNRNFEKTKRQHPADNSHTEESLARARKYKKRVRGIGGIKGQFRIMRDSQINQEKYFTGA